MAYSRRTLAKNTDADARHASAAAMRLLASAVACGVRRMGMMSASAACAASRRPTPSKYAWAFFSDSMEICSPTSASTKIIIGEGTAVSLGGGRSYSNRHTTKSPSPGKYFISTLVMGAFHRGRRVRKAESVAVGLRHSVAGIGVSSVSCAAVASSGWSA